MIRDGYDPGSYFNPRRPKATRNRKPTVQVSAALKKRMKEEDEYDYDYDYDYEYDDEEEEDDDENLEVETEVEPEVEPDFDSFEPASNPPKYDNPPITVEPPESFFKAPTSNPKPPKVSSEDAETNTQVPPQNVKPKSSVAPTQLLNDTRGRKAKHDRRQRNPVGIGRKKGAPSNYKRPGRKALPSPFSRDTAKKNLKSDFDDYVANRARRSVKKRVRKGRVRRTKQGEDNFNRDSVQTYCSYFSEVEEAKARGFESVEFKDSDIPVPDTNGRDDVLDSNMSI